jgi:hypothetical protein
VFCGDGAGCLILNDFSMFLPGLAVGISGSLPLADYLDGGYSLVMPIVENGHDMCNKGHHAARGMVERGGA